MQYGKLIGAGHTASIYEWGAEKVVKLFQQGYPEDAVKREFHNAMVIRDMDFLKPKAYELVDIGCQNGIIYDRIDGESLLDWLMKTGDLQACAYYMAELHKRIIQNKAEDIPDYKHFLSYHLNAASAPDPEKKELLQKLGRLPEGNTLCHGDFHPGNIMISDGRLYVIDFMNICRGSCLYDIARTVFLVEYTPVPEEADNKELLLHYKKTLTDLYLANMKLTREMLQDYLEIIIAARAGEM